MAFSYDIFADNPEEGTTKEPEASFGAEEAAPIVPSEEVVPVTPEEQSYASENAFDINAEDDASSVAPAPIQPVVEPPTIKAGEEDDLDPFGNNPAVVAKTTEQTASNGEPQDIKYAASEASEEEAPWSATMTVNGTIYASTIFWQPLQDPDNPLPEVRETAENVLENSDLYVIRPTGMPQYGLGISAEGHKSGMPVAALALVDAFSDVPSSVSVFRVPEGWWFIAIRNDLILPEDDILYQKEEDAKRTFLSMMAVPDWGRKVAPSEWEIEGTEPFAIEDVFSKAPKVKLVKLKKEFNFKTIAILAVAVVLVAWGGFALLSYFFGGSEKIQEVIAPPPVIKSIIEKPKVVSVPMPWETLIVPTDFVDTCVSATGKLAAAKIPGWNIGDITCQTTGLTTAWTMQEGRLGNFQTALKIYNIEGLNFTINDNGRSATGSINFANLRKAYSAPKLRTPEITTELTDIFQALNIPLAVNVTNVNPTGDPARPEAPKPDPYSYVNFSFSSTLPTSEWTSFFNRFDALELTRMVYNINSNNWKYEGRIYGKN